MLKKNLVLAGLFMSLFAIQISAFGGSVTTNDKNALVFDMKKPSLDATALNIMLAQQPLADLTSSYTITGWKNIRDELKAVLEFVYPNTKADRDAFLEYPAFEYGVVLFQPQGALATRLSQMIPENSSLKINSKFSSGNLIFDLLLKKWNVSEIVNSGFTMKLKFDASVNPLLVSSSAALIEDIKWMEPNGQGVIGSSHNISRMNSNPAVYRLEIGQGDCPSGCIERHQTFVEIKALSSGKYDIKILAESGSDLGPN